LKFCAASRAHLATDREGLSQEMEVADTKPQANRLGCAWKRRQNPRTSGFVEFDIRVVERNRVHSRRVHRSPHLDRRHLALMLRTQASCRRDPFRWTASGSNRYALVARRRSLRSLRRTYTRSGVTSSAVRFGAFSTYILIEDVPAVHWTVWQRVLVNVFAATH